jgi:hypothetical protein
MGASGVEYILMQQVIIGSETAVFEFALKAIASLIALVGASRASFGKHVFGLLDFKYIPAITSRPPNRMFL